MSTGQRILFGIGLVLTAIASLISSLWETSLINAIAGSQ